MKLFILPVESFIVLFVFSSLNLLAQKDFQPGYLLTPDMDTLYGQIDLQAIPKMYAVYLGLEYRLQAK